jgi:hypothetical protein
MKTDKSQVQGNRQGGGDQTGKRNRTQGLMPRGNRKDEQLQRGAEQSRDAKGSAHAAASRAVVPQPESTLDVQ